MLDEKLMHGAGNADLLVLALPWRRAGGFRGGECAAGAAGRFVVCKLGFPGHEEYAMDAIASGGFRVICPMPGFSVSPEAVAEVVAHEQAELVRREQLYRGQWPALSLIGRTEIVVDDGLATGATMRAALLVICQQHPARLVVAAPVGAEDTCRALQGEADEVVCAAMPQPFRAVGLWYKIFRKPATKRSSRC